MSIKIINTLATANASKTSLVKMLTSQTISNNVFTKAVYGTVVSDETGCWNATNNRFIVPSGVISVKVSASVYWASSSTNGRWCEIRKNGNTSYSGVARNYVQAITDTHQNCLSALLSVTSGDYFEAWVCQNSNSSLNIEANTDQNRCWNWFQIEMFY